MSGPPKALRGIADAVEAWLERDNPAIALHAGRPVRQLATLDPDRITANAAFLADRLVELRGLDPNRLTAAERAFRRALAVDLERRVEAAESRLLAFAVTPYRGGDLHAEARAALLAHPLDEASERDAYLELARDYGRLLREILAHTREQAGQSILLPRAALPGARATLSALRAELPGTVRPSRSRLGDAGDAAAGLVAAVDAILEREIEPALEALLACLDAGYAARAPAEGGCGVQPGGGAFYRQQVALFADTDLAPEEIHRLGREMLDALRRERESLARALVPGAELADAERRLRDDPRARARTAEEIEARFTRHMRRIEPLMPQWFLRQPRAPWAVTRASPSAEGGMTYGDYQRPTPADPVGRYRYNGYAPETRSLLGTAHLIYHELLPGHHYQLSLQGEAEVVHPLQAHLLSMATIEGWAVYSSDLAAEMGAMEPFDLYGHTVMRCFIAARLVVDTGLNALGWTMGEAAAFMREHTAESDELIGSEIVRYATDIPGQALAYGLGGRAIADLRCGAERALGGAFDVRLFHDRLLGQGGYPLPVLGDIVAEWVTEQREGATA